MMRKRPHATHRPPSLTALGQYSTFESSHAVWPTRHSAESLMPACHMAPQRMVLGRSVCICVCLCTVLCPLSLRAMATTSPTPTPLQYTHRYKWTHASMACGVCLATTVPRGIFPSLHLSVYLFPHTCLCPLPIPMLPCCHVSMLDTRVE